MNLTDPVRVYTAASNTDAQMVAEMLNAGGVKAHAVEDQSGVSLWFLGPMSQYHQPDVFVSGADVDRAKKLIAQFEQWHRNRSEHGQEITQILATCDVCGQKTLFPADLQGTVQDCPHCGDFIDVGELPWDSDVGEPEE